MAVLVTSDSSMQCRVQSSAVDVLLWYRVYMMWWGLSRQPILDSIPSWTSLSSKFLCLSE